MLFLPVKQMLQKASEYHFHVLGGFFSCVEECSQRVSPYAEYNFSGLFSDNFNFINPTSWPYESVLDKKLS